MYLYSLTVWGEILMTGLCGKERSVLTVCIKLKVRISTQ